MIFVCCSTYVTFNCWLSNSCSITHLRQSLSSLHKSKCPSTVAKKSLYIVLTCPLWYDASPLSCGGPALSQDRHWHCGCASARHCYLLAFAGASPQAPPQLEQIRTTLKTVRHIVPQQILSYIFINYISIASKINSGQNF